MTRRFPRDVESARTGTPVDSVASRFTRLFLDLRTSFGREPDLLPIRPPPDLSGWPPLKIEKDGLQNECFCQKDLGRHRLKDVGAVLLIIMMTFLSVNVIFLEIRVLAGSPAKSSPELRIFPNTSLFPSAIPVGAQACIFQYESLTAINTSTYLCASCLPLLRALPSDFRNENGTVMQTIQDAVQFCSLKAVFDSGGSDAQMSMENAGWLKDAKFCSWCGVSCDNFGRVSSL